MMSGVSFRYLGSILLAALLAASRALEVEELRATASLAPHLAAAFDEIAACHLSPSGEYLIFDRRAHAVYTIARGAEAPKRIVQIGSESGRIIRPTAFDSVPDGSFVIADAPGDRQRVQFFSASGTSLGGFTMPGRGVPQITLGELVLSGLGTLEYTGQSVLISQPELGSLVVEYVATGSPLRTFGELRQTGQENDPQVHAALNVGIILVNPKGGYYFVFLSGVPMFRKYDGSGKFVFERHIEGVEIDPYVKRLPTTWPRKRGEFPIVPAMVRTAAVDADGNLWISLAAPFTYVYDSFGDKRRTLQFRGAGIIPPTSFFFTRDRHVVITPGCYSFEPGR
jgi:hypothetical protein